jgi:putative acetyltransferase
LLRISEIEREKDLNEVKKLFGDYASSLEISLDFQDFDQELASLPGDYSPPD